VRVEWVARTEEDRGAGGEGGEVWGESRRGSWEVVRKGGGVGGCIEGGGGRKIGGRMGKGAGAMRRGDESEGTKKRANGRGWGGRGREEWKNRVRG